MTHLGTLEGRGQIMVPDQREMSITYRIDVFRDRSLKTGTGSFATDLKTAVSLIERGALTLRLSTGATVSIVVTHADGDGVEFRTSGPIPGF